MIEHFDGISDGHFEFIDGLLFECLLGRYSNESSVGSKILMT